MADGYNAGDLNVTIQALGENSVKSLDAVIERLNKIKSLISTIDVGTISSKVGRARANGSGDFTRKQQVFKSIGNGKEFESMAKEIQKVNGKVKTTTQYFDEQHKQIKSIVSSTDEYGNKITKIQQAEKSGGFFSAFKMIGKLGAVIGITRRYARIAGQILQFGVDYTETLNLWQVSMRDNVDAASEYIRKMREAYGISEQTLMNAQAIFKNMLSSMGGIADEAAYRLSESVTKMAIDYASLYNVEIDDAMTKFQAALAGQVRPIRSTSGYDITENTLYQLYQAMGGEKTMRQLSQTERRLLAIYAIFQQMGATGALGDMEKTLGNFANQARMATENWKQLSTWVGITLQNMLQQSNVMIYINALLSLAADIAKSFAFSMGYVNPDFGITFADGMEKAGEETDKLKGKLLGFDKFRALNQSEDNMSDTLGIDETILKAMEDYRSQINGANNAAEQLKKKWADMLHLVDENGDGIYDNTENLENLLNVLKLVGVALGVIVGFSAIALLRKAIPLIFNLKNALMLLNVALVAGIIFAFYEAIKAFKEGDKATGILASAIGVTLVGALILLKTTLIDGKLYIDLFGKTLSGAFVLPMMGLAALTAGIVYFVTNLKNMKTSAKILVPTLAALAGVIAALAAGFTVLKGNWLGAISVGALVAGAGLLVGTKLATMKDYAEGGLPDKGTVFRAGEAGAEIVYNTPSGQSGVANVQQIQQAMYNALVAYGNTHKDDKEIVVYLDGEVVYKNTTSKAKAHGNVWAKA